MNVETVFEFIKNKRGYDFPVKYKLINGMELTEEDLDVYGDLKLGYTNITSLPNNLKVGGNLSLFDSGITTLPNNLHVGGNLLLFGTNLKSLPNNLYVGSSLFLNGVGITSIPNNLYVGGNLFLRETPLSAYYSTYDILKMIEKKGGYITGKIYLDYDELGF